MRFFRIILPTLPVTYIFLIPLLPVANMACTETVVVFAIQSAGT